MTGFESLRWREAGGRSPPALVLLDQTRLPEEERRIPCADVESVAEAIESLRVRGAPAIGVAAAYGVALGAWHGIGSECMRATVEGTVERLGRTRPTAVNLFQALDRMDSALEEAAGLADVEVYHRLVAEARGLQAADADLCRRIGEHGAALLEDGDTVLTHCNAGALATAGWGTALGVVYAAAESGKRVHVYAGETRPLLQGSRLTSWELQRRGVAVTVICDGAAGAVLRDRGVDCVITGSDRIAANGDVANKIGTYGLALMARARGIPLYVAAPTTTVDPELATGDRIPIEERAPEEITNGFGRATVPEGVAVYNPAFDVTPHELVSAIITEHGISRPPYTGSLPGPGKGA